MSAFVGYVSPRCAVRVAAGDLAARLLRLPHRDYAELVILRELGPRAFFGDAFSRDALVPGPHIERLDVGDPLRLWVRGQIGDVAALERAGDRLRHSVRELAAVAQHLTTAVRS